MKWPVVQIGSVAEQVERHVPVDPETEYTQIGVRLWGRGAYARTAILGKETKYRTLNRFLAGDIVVNKIWARNGSVAVVPDELDGCVGSGEFPCYEIDQRQLSPRWFSRLTQWHPFWKQCEELSRGSTGKNRIRPERFLEVEIPLPPRPEQERIADILEHALARIAEARQLHDSLSGEQRALLSARARELAEGVPRQPMREVAPLVRRPITIKKTATYPELGIRSFGRGTFHKPALTSEAVRTKRLFSIEPGDLLFSNVFAWEGAIAVARPEDAGRCGSHRFITCLPHPDIATPEFLCFWFLSDEGMAHIRAASPGAAGRNRTLGLTKLAEIPVPVPSISLQQAFSRLCNQLESASTLQRDFPAELEALQSSLLDQAFSGNL